MYDGQLKFKDVYVDNIINLHLLRTPLNPNLDAFLNFSYVHLNDSVTDTFTWQAKINGFDIDS